MALHIGRRGPAHLGRTFAAVAAGPATLLNADFTAGDTPTSKGFAYTRSGAVHSYTTAGAVQTFATDAAPVTDDGLRIERGRTNKVVYSQDITRSPQFGFDGLNIATNPSATNAPDGTATAVDFTDSTNGAANRHVTGYEGPTGSATSLGSGDYCASIYVRPGAATPLQFFGIAMDSTSGNFAGQVWDITSGAAGSTNALGTTAVASGNALALTNSWYRISLGVNVSSTASYEMLPGASNLLSPTFFRGEAAYAASSKKAILWQYDLQDTVSYPLASIPTSGAAVTVANALCSKTISGPTGDYRVTVKPKFTRGANKVRTVWSWNDGTDAYEVRVDIDTAHKLKLVVTYAGVTTTATAAAATTFPSTPVVVVDRTGPDFTLKVDGTLVGTLAAQDSPPVSIFQLGSNALQTQFLDDLIRTVKIEDLGGAHRGATPSYSTAQGVIIGNDTILGRTSPFAVTQTTRGTVVWAINAAFDPANQGTSPGGTSMSGMVHGGNKVVESGATLWKPEFSTLNAGENASGVSWAYDNNIRPSFNTGSATFGSSGQEISASWSASNTPNTRWVVFIMSWDSATGKMAIYQDGVCLTAGATTISTGIVNSPNAVANWNNGSGFWYGNGWNGASAWAQHGLLFVDTETCIANADGTIDASYRGKFAANGRVLDLGVTGATPLGHQPEIYLPFADAASAGTNLGSAGNLTVRPSQQQTVNVATAGNRFYGVLKPPYGPGQAIPSTPFMRWTSVGNPILGNTSGTFTVLRRSYKINVGEPLVLTAYIQNGHATPFDATFALPTKTGSNDWTLVAKGWDSANTNYAVWWKLAEAADVALAATGGWALNWTAPAEVVAGVATITGYGSATRVDAAQVAYSASSGSPASPSLSTVNANSLAAQIWMSISGDKSWNPAAQTDLRARTPRADANTYYTAITDEAAAGAGTTVGGRAMTIKDPTNISADTALKIVSATVVVS